MLEKCQKILNHGINCFINRQLIYNLPEQFFAEKGVMAIEHADFDGIERLSLVTGSEIVSTFDHPELVKTGTCKLIEEIMVGEDKVWRPFFVSFHFDPSACTFLPCSDCWRSLSIPSHICLFFLFNSKMIKFSGVSLGEACTIILRGSSQQLLDEAERSLHDALCVLQQTVKDPRVVLGGGASEVEMARAVEELAAKTPGKQSLAMEAYARALRMIPTIIADNAGYDSSELVAQLRAAHANGNLTAGLDMKNGIVGNMEELGITEPWRVKNQIIISATEAAEMILRVDDIITAAPRKRENDPRYGGHAGHGH
jgi:T-complex protein 1 subunit beta